MNPAQKHVCSLLPCYGLIVSDRSDVAVMTQKARGKEWAGTPSSSVTSMDMNWLFIQENEEMAVVALLIIWPSQQKKTLNFYADFPWHL